MLTGGSIDALNPQRTEIALPDLTVAISVLSGLFNGLLGNANSALATAVVTLGSLQNLLVTSVAVTPLFTRDMGGLL